MKIGTAFNTAFRLEIRHEAWQEPSVIKTRLPCVSVQGNRALSGSNWAAVRHCFNRRDHEWHSLGSGGQNSICQPFPLIFGHCGHFQPLPPIFAIWCPDRLAVSGDFKIGTAFNTAFRLEIRHEAWQEPSVIKTRLPCVSVRSLSGTIISYFGFRDDFSILWHACHLSISLNANDYLKGLVHLIHIRARIGLLRNRMQSGASFAYSRRSVCFSHRGADHFCHFGPTCHTSNAARNLHHGNSHNNHSTAGDPNTEEHAKANFTARPCANASPMQHPVGKGSCGGSYLSVPSDTCW